MERNLRKKFYLLTLLISFIFTTKAFNEFEYRFANVPTFFENLKEKSYSIGYSNLDLNFLNIKLPIKHTFYDIYLMKLDDVLVVTPSITNEENVEQFNFRAKRKFKNNIYPEIFFSTYNSSSIDKFWKLNFNISKEFYFKNNFAIACRIENLFSIVKTDVDSYSDNKGLSLSVKTKFRNFNGKIEVGSSFFEGGKIIPLLITTYYFNQYNLNLWVRKSEKGLKFNFKKLNLSFIDNDWGQIVSIGFFF